MEAEKLIIHVRGFGAIISEEDFEKIKKIATKVISFERHETSEELYIEDYTIEIPKMSLIDLLELESVPDTEFILVNRKEDNVTFHRYCAE